MWSLAETMSEMHCGVSQRLSETVWWQKSVCQVEITYTTVWCSCICLSFSTCCFHIGIF